MYRPPGADVCVTEDAGSHLVLDDVEVARLGPGPGPAPWRARWRWHSSWRRRGRAPAASAAFPSLPTDGVATAAGGFVVLDDTYNANPSGARAAVQALERADRRLAVGWW